MKLKTNPTAIKIAVMAIFLVKKSEGNTFSLALDLISLNFKSTYFGLLNY